MTKSRKQPPLQYDLHRNIPPLDTRQAGQELKPNEPAERPKRWLSWKKAVALFALLILTSVLVIGVWDYRNFARASNKLFGSTNIVDLVSTTALDQSEGRVNILLVGYSADDPGHAGALLTDSIMVLSLNPAHKSGYMLSIPRDLYVNIPDYGYGKINEAFEAGERGGYPGGGVALLKHVVSEKFGLALHYYALINYAAVRDIVNALDGVQVKIDSPDPRGIYDPNFRPSEGGPLQLPNGTHQLDGQAALRLTRARGATYGSYGFPQSDFNRTKNQQQVLSAIKQELNWTLVLNPKVNGKIFNAVAGNIKTDLRLSEVLPLFRLLNTIPTASLQPVSLNDSNGVNLLTGYTTPTGQSARVPAAGIDNFTDIKAIVKDL